MVIEVLEPNFHKLRAKLISGDLKTIDEMMQAHTEYLDECLKGCLLTDHNLFRILTRLNQNNIFFARIIQRLFQQLGTNEVHDRALADNEYYGKHSSLYRDEEDEHTVDAMAMRRRKERIDGKSESLKRAFQENSYGRMVEKFETTFDDTMRELL